MNLARAANGPQGHGTFTLSLEGPCPSDAKENRRAH
jgi:hypothetical protein